MKTCTKCGETREETDFYMNGSRRQSHCKTCMKAKADAYQRANKAAHQKAVKRWKAKNPERTKAYVKKSRTKNSERVSAVKAAWRVRNYQTVRQQWCEWSKANPEKLRAKDMKRKAVKLRAIPPWADKEKIEEFYFAADFLGMVTGEWYHVDHIAPLQSKFVCGLHCEQNLQVLPASANLRKSNRHWPDMP